MVYDLFVDQKVSFSISLGYTRPYVFPECCKLLARDFYTIPLSDSHLEISSGIVLLESCGSKTL
jgi:hypothetical protein